MPVVVGEDEEVTEYSETVDDIMRAGMKQLHNISEMMKRYGTTKGLFSKERLF